MWLCSTLTASVSFDSKVVNNEGLIQINIFVIFCRGRETHFPWKLFGHESHGGVFEAGRRFVPALDSQPICWQCQSESGGMRSGPTQGWQPDCPAKAAEESQIQSRAGLEQNPYLSSKFPQVNI
jgi:hypothetical protein